MPKFKNVSSLGDLDVPALGLSVKAGEVVEVSVEDAVALYAQPDVWVIESGEKDVLKAIAASARGEASDEPEEEIASEENVEGGEL